MKPNQFIRSAASASLAILSGTIVLQAYFSLFAASSFGRFAEFPGILFYATCIVVPLYAAIIGPAFSASRRIQSKSLFSLACIGCAGGFFLMLLLIAITGWPGQSMDNKLAYLISGIVTGGIAVVTYARFQAFQRL